MSNVFTNFKRNPERDINTIKTIKNNIDTTNHNTNKLEAINFLNYVQISFSNNKYANAMFIDSFDNKVYFNTTKNMEINTKNKYLYLNNTKESGFSISVEIKSTITDKETLNNFFIIDDNTYSFGSFIKYYLINDKGEEFPIKPNNSLPFKLTQDTSKFQIKIVMNKDNNNVTPILRGIAVLYHDKAIDKTYGLINPDLSRFTFDQSSTTTLVRDRLQNDNLIRVETENSVTTLKYNKDDKLISTTTEDKFTISITYLYYGQYLNSKDKIEEELLSIMNVTRNKERSD